MKFLITLNREMLILSVSTMPRSNLSKHIHAQDKILYPDIVRFIISNKSDTILHNNTEKSF